MKTDGSITFEASVSGLQLREAMEVGIYQQNIVGAEIWTEQSLIYIKFKLDRIYSLGDASMVTSGLAQVFADKIAFKFNCQIGELRCYSHAIPNPEGSQYGYTVEGSIVIMYDLLEGDTVPDENSRKSVVALLQEPASDVDVYLHMYSFAISQSDPTAKFVYLYQLLLQLTGGNQRQADKAILEIVPATPMSKSPHDKHYESIYTKLRNEIAHKRDGVSLREVGKRIEEVIMPFQAVVSSLIHNKFE